MTHRSAARQAQPARVTVLMPLRNAAPYLREAIDSVLAQTYEQFHLLVIDDGSTDETPQILTSIDDPRLTCVRHAGAGIVAALNHGLELTQTSYIARFDGDDLMRPDRLERQVAYLDANPRTVACGTDYRTFGALETIVLAPRTPARSRARQFFWPALGHPTSMMRRSVLVDNHIRYREDYPHAEDYKFFSELAQYGDLVGLPFVGIDYRIHRESVSVVKRTGQRQTAARIATENIRATGMNISTERVAKLLWGDRHGVGGAVRYLLADAPVMLVIASRAEGMAGLIEVLKVIRERVNSIIRIPPTSPLAA